MALIHYDSNKIQTTVEPDLADAIANLRNCSIRMAVPNSFRYIGFLRDFSSTVSYSRSSLNRLQSWLNVCKRNFERIEEGTSNNLKNINLNVNSREKFIK